MIDKKNVKKYRSTLWERWKMYNRPLNRLITTSKVVIGSIALIFASLDRPIDMETGEQVLDAKWEEINKEPKLEPKKLYPNTPEDLPLEEKFRRYNEQLLYDREVSKQRVKDSSVYNLVEEALEKADQVLGIDTEKQEQIKEDIIRKNQAKKPSLAARADAFLNDLVGINTDDNERGGR